ncbi:MAG: hypothetical protein L3K15_05360 [Thermoplasmata archaeon]|nr:hypothetical protein [Thermoplasmata archaeon]
MPDLPCVPTLGARWWSVQIRRALAHSGRAEAGFVVAGMLLLVGLAGTAPGAAGLPASPTGLALVGSVCPGTLDPHAFAGTLAIVGGSLPATSVANVSVNLTYHYLYNDTTKGGGTTFTCRVGSVSGATGSDGRFTLNASLPADFCTSTTCATYTGPFGTLAFGTPPSPPAGYFHKVDRTGGSVALSFVEAQSAVTLAPAGRLTVSVDAATNVRASVVAADGSPSPAILEDGWQLTGAGWTFATPPTGANATVLATSNAGPGSLSLTVNGSFRGSPVSLPPVTLGLTAVATSIRDGNMFPTALDAGSAASVVINGGGAAGYAYTAWFSPGPGPGSVPLACTTNATPGGTVGILCQGRAIFPVRGTTVPVATLTNGFSEVSSTFSPVVVAAGLGFAVTPDPAGAYAGSLVSYDVSVAGGSGTAPFGPACLAFGDGATYCDRTPGPTWHLIIPAPPVGSWNGAASVADAGGANVSVPVVTTVVDRLSLSALLTPTNVVTAGDSVAVRAVLAGGLLPAEYWWNLSAPATTVAAGTVSADGLVAINVTPLLAGDLVLTLTIRDGLGTTVANATTFSVAPGPATRLSADAVTGNATAAGVPVAITLAALNVLGDRVTSFAAGVNVTVSGPSGVLGAGVGVTGAAGPVFTLGSGGHVALPSSAWHHGELNVTFTATIAGRWLVVFATAPGTAGSTTGGLVVDVAPDTDHLELSRPLVVTAGARTNATLYTIGDVFGNSLAAGYVVIQSLFGGELTIRHAPVLVDHGRSTVWVNYSAPSGSGGTVDVTSAAGEPLLPTLQVPAGLAPTLTPLAIGGLALLGAAVGATGATVVVVRRRRRGRGTAPAEVAEGELERLAAGRARILTELENGRSLTLEELRAGLGLLDPTDGEIAEWVGSLVTEGSVRPHPTESGRTAFAAVPYADPVAPRVELDPAALDRALESRDADPVADD